MGQMVTEIAHQLNNPLVGVINLAELAEREIGNQARVKELLGQVRTAGEHCREYVQRMLGLSQLARSETQVTDLGRLVQETVVFFQQSLGQHPVAAFEAPAEPISCEVDPVLIRNALFNLIHNAAQADPNGPILVSLTREQRDGKLGYSLAVSDRGSGIPPGAADKLLRRFSQRGRTAPASVCQSPSKSPFCTVALSALRIDRTEDRDLRSGFQQSETTREIENSASRR